ncbi:MAG: DUF4124 domain-containing protein [Gammaproteobacteria bacterium]|nr:DUF4124 domain-containing protein [Gammaproteobacteria bacterium]
MSYRYLLLFLLVTCWPAQAEIFKCVAPNGELTFSQTPCPGKDSKVTVERTATTKNDDEADCKFAQRFALTTARQMKRGVTSSKVFDQYGGLSALSRGSVGLISYVYQYRTNEDVSAERVAALSVAKCKAKSFGDVSCEQLPASYTNGLGGCEMSDSIVDAMMEEKERFESPPSTGAAAPSQSRNRVSSKTSAWQHAEYRKAQTAKEERRAACKKRIRDKIDAINAELRSGYSASRGITQRNWRRDLEQQLREC